MWYDILPSILIIGCAMAVPTYFTYCMNWFVLGNPHRRSLINQDLRMQYLRTIHLTGDPYNVNGLECVPDEDPKEECKEGEVEDCPEGQEYVEDEKTE
ncbi:uncharacterized protein LOC126742256 [Anthonomus grandis grandis]|uniref:uncharacterized protein LOC126742256 n=1 Tax=Anthonomus grandis grandis TaxID=2921223 RepID=UPI00216529F1|nr:uncharacterized protein LOC126742256 [Anthonomus grandis grandis]